MKSVFEKIIEKLEEKQDIFLYDDSDYGEGKYNAFDEAIEIVKQEAVEYNNGWIPCSERLPEERDWYLCVFREKDTGFQLIPRVADFMQAPEKSHATYDGWMIIDYEGMTSEYLKLLECVAWQPLPEPYNPTGMNRAKTKDGKYEPYLGGWK